MKNAILSLNEIIDIAIPPKHVNKAINACFILSLLINMILLSFLEYLTFEFNLVLGFIILNITFLILWGWFQQNLKAKLKC